MIIAFASTDVRDICEDAGAGDQSIGREAGRMLRDRLADIRAAVTLGDLMVGNPRTGGEDGRELRIDLTDAKTLVLIANHVALPQGRPGTGVDWTRVSYVKVIGVESS